MNISTSNSIRVSASLWVPLHEVEMVAVRSSGSGGQNVNKVATAIHLRFDIRASSLPDSIKARLLRLNDRRISREGMVIIKAQEHRTQEKNRQAALDRLAELIRSATRVRRKRVPTGPSREARRRRMEDKRRRGGLKVLRRTVREEPD